MCKERRFWFEKVDYGRRMCCECSWETEIKDSECDLVSEQHTSLLEHPKVTFVASMGIQKLSYPDLMDFGASGTLRRAIRVAAFSP
jgi:hypothetical protein